MRRALVVICVWGLPSLAFAQSPSTKEPMLIQLFEDVSRARQAAEVELASCKVLVKDLQQLQAAAEKTTAPVKEKK